jgi:hypothetical protein
MGKINSGILGGFSGKIGPVIGGAWKGINYMRSKPTSVANPNTPPQQAQRGKFLGVVLAAQALLGNIIQTFWNPISARMSGYNYFVSQNIAAFEAAGIDTPTLFNLTRGPILGIPSFSVVADASLASVTITWSDNSGVGNALATDQVIWGYWNKSKGYWMTKYGSAQRPTASDTITDAQMDATNELYVYVGFQRFQDNSQCSDSTYALAAVIP